MNKPITTLFTLITLSLLSSCTTSYGPNGLTGGYKEKKIDDDSYIVSFFGNGHTGNQQVWNFWIYRCAELTLQKGYKFFELQPSEVHAGFRKELRTGDQENYYRFTMLPIDNAQTEKALSNNESIKGASEINPTLRPANYYYYTVTTYSSKGIVNMYKPPVPQDAGLLLDAKTIMKNLKPYVMSPSKTIPPERNDLFVRSAVEAAIRSNRIKSGEADQFKHYLRNIL